MAVEDTIKIGAIIAISLVILLVITKIIKLTNRNIEKIDDSSYITKGCLNLGINIYSPEENKDLVNVPRESINKLLAIFNPFFIETKKIEKMKKYCAYNGKDNTIYLPDIGNCAPFSCKDGFCVNLIKCQCANKILYICRKIQEYYIKFGVLNNTIIEKAIEEIK